jgi:DNA-binding beta-propeller fold protein YncE
MSPRLIAFTLVATLGCASAAAAQTAPYAPAGAVALGAPDRWDYVTISPALHRVFVAHGSGVSVVDSDTGALVGVVGGIAGGTHGVVVSPISGHGYTDDGKAGLVVVFDPAAQKILKTLKASPDADAIAQDPKTGRLFVVAGDSQNLTVVDPATDTVVQVIPTGEKMEFAVADGAGSLYVNGVDTRDILRVDTASGKVLARWPIPDCEGPHGLAIDAATRRLFSSCVNAKMMVVDADDGKVVAELPIGLGSDAAAFDPSTRRAFSSNGKDGTVTVIQQDGPDAYRVLGEVPTAKSGRTMAVDPTTGRLYVAAATLSGQLGANGRPMATPGSLHLLVFAPTPRGAGVEPTFLFSRKADTGQR